MTNHKKAGKLLRDKLLARDPDYYRKLGKLGGSTPKRPGGFAVMDKDKLREAARKGGRTRVENYKRSQKQS